MKLTFRPLTPADTQTLFDIYSDKEAMKYRGSKPMKTLQDAEQYIREQWFQKGSVFTIREGVELASSHTLIGSVMYRYDETKLGECEIGYSIGRAFWGKGYGHAILKMMLIELQARKEVEHIVAGCHKDNIASVKVLAKAGFKCIEQKETSDILVYQKQNH